MEVLLGFKDCIPFFLVSYALLGAGLKYIDAAFDEETMSKRKAMAIAPFLGALWVYVMIIDWVSAVILSAIILGVLLRGKIDNPAHSMGLFVIVFFVLISGLSISFLLLAFLTASAYMDEVGNDIIDKIRRRGRFRDVFLRYFFGRRCLLKVAVLYLVLIGIFPMYSLVALIFFDESYIIVDDYSREMLKRRISNSKEISP